MLTTLAGLPVETDAAIDEEDLDAFGLVCGRDEVLRCVRQGFRTHEDVHKAVLGGELSRHDLNACVERVRRTEGEPRYWRMHPRLAAWLAMLLPPEPPDTSVVRAGPGTPLPDRG